MKKNQLDWAHVAEQYGLSVEFVTEPNSWLPIQSVEAFLESAEDLLSQCQEPVTLKEMGHKAPQIHEWGVLDGVLRLMESYKEVFEHPKRFFTFFISPDPYFEKVSRTFDNNTANNFKQTHFKTDMDSSRYPNICNYLSGSLESLSEANDTNTILVDWTFNDIILKELETQPPLNEESLVKPPEAHHKVIKSLIEELEKKSQEVLELKESTKKSTKAQVEQQEQLGLFIKDTAIPDSVSPSKKATASLELQGEISRLEDYFSRAQQLITLLVGQNRADKQVKSAMKRMNWEETQKQFKSTISDLMSQTKD